MEACWSRFTAAEGGARLAAAAASKNTLAVEYASFIATRLVYEDAYKIRGSLLAGSQRSVYVTRATRVPVAAYELHILTDLAVAKALRYEDVEDWSAELEKKEVLICTSAVLNQILDEGILSMSKINVLVLDSCHLVSKDSSLQHIMKYYKECEQDKRPRILALTYPLFAPPKKDAETKDETKPEKLPQIDEEKETDDQNKDKAVSLTQERNEKGTEKETETENTQEVSIADKTLDRNVKDTEKPTETEKTREVSTADETLDRNVKDTEKPTEIEKTEEVSVAVETLDRNVKDTEKPTETEATQEDVIIDSNTDTPKDLIEETKPDVKKVSDAEEMGVYENLDDFQMYEKLEWKIEELEKGLCCQMDLAEDIDGGKRLSSTVTKPRELIIEYSGLRAQGDLPEEYSELEAFMRDTVCDAISFIDEHRYDPTEIYGEDLYEEFMSIPDPTIDPRHIFKQFLYVLDQLGPYAADKAAFSLLTKLEKLKIKVPYERHFLLLCLCTSVFVKIRCYADDVFSKFESDWDKIKHFSTPKVLRFAEILEKFQPPDQRETKDIDLKLDSASKTNEMLKAIENCDFLTLSNKIEDRVNTLEANLKEIEDFTAENTTDTNIIDTNENATTDMNSLPENSSTVSDVQNGEHCDQNENGDEQIEDNSSQNDANHSQNDTNLTQNDTNHSQNYTNHVQNDANHAQNDANLSQNATNLSQTDNNHGQNDTNPNENVVEQSGQRGIEGQKGGLGFPRRAGHRARGRGRVQRNNAARVQQMQMNPDALCGIVFMKEALMAKIMFMLIVEMSRSNSKLSHLCAQYCAVEQPLGPGAEPRECQRQGRKQEDVLKKFRMHECNLLLATSALEEGIDLPRCNLVLRWDVPPSYRSYGLCRSRGRAPRAACALLALGSQAEGEGLLHHVAVYRELDQIISRKCGCGFQDEPPQTEEDHADSFTLLVKPYTPCDSCTQDKDKTIKEKRTDGANETTSGNCEEIVNNEIYVNIELDVTLTSKVDNTVIDSIKLTNEHKILHTDIDNENLICNKCNNKRNSAYSECPCVLSDRSVNINNCVENKSENRRSDKKSDDGVASVDLSTAIALINRYCGKLPSDTFTRLAPQWWMEEVQLPTRNGETHKAYICTLRLPLNCPVKYNIVGHPMPTKALARRMAALQACRVLHRSGELDDHLMPIGKENFKAAELDTPQMNGDTEPNDSARPGTTKRRQYYFKRTAWAFTDCQPVVDSSDADIDPIDVSPSTPSPEARTKPAGQKRNMLYALVSRLWCALPERYNTRGRRLHAPQHAHQAIGLLMARTEPDSLQIPAFPVYTRSGEVRVSVEHVPDADVRVSPRRGRLVRRFMRFVFAEVLRVRRRGMRLHADSPTNNYYVVPTIKTTREDGTTKIDIDWQFLELIYKHTEEKRHSEIGKPILWNQDEEDDAIDTAAEQKETPKGKKMENPLLKEGETFVFDAEKYKEAVVTPWYRNQDQPQFFLVAEICWALSPDSAFPSATHSSFRDYYGTKYGVQLTQPKQPLLDVDHTSARLNLLTPRYVNRKGVALPVSSERTRRAKRDRLDQKQILVPELCTVHPFAAPLWFATVALPCVLYRINALLIADEIRRSVAIDVGLGIPKIDDSTLPGFQWPPLDFGWSLAEVLNADCEKSEKKKDDEDDTKKEDKELKEKGEDEEKQKTEEESVKEEKEKTINDILQEKEAAESGFEIGTWSNDMASSIPQEYDAFHEPLPSNLTLCTSASGGANWCDPVEKPKREFNPRYSMADSDCSYMSSDFDTDDSDLNSEVSDDDTDTSGFCSSKNSNAAMGVRIEYKTAHEAEAVDLERKNKVNPSPQPDEEDDAADRRLYDEYIRAGEAPEQYIEKFRLSVAEHKKDIVEKGHLIRQDEPIVEILPETRETRQKLAQTELKDKVDGTTAEFHEIFPYGTDKIDFLDKQISLESIEKNKRVLLAELKRSLTKEEIKKLHCFSMADVDIDSPSYVNEKVVNVGFDTKEAYIDKVNRCEREYTPYYQDGKGQEFDFDYQPRLEGHPGPSPSVILQALTMSNANDGINLERLETIGDSFLKFAITAYLYCAHPTVHEGKLSHMRSKQVSNLNLYRLGRGRRLGARMIASKFEPHDNWLPPCHCPPAALHQPDGQEAPPKNQDGARDSSGCFIPYNLITQHSIPDKSIADCVEALIGAYLLECGPRGALLFMSWLGIRVLPQHRLPLPRDHPYVARHEEEAQQKPPPSPKHASDSDSSQSSDEEPSPTAAPEQDWGWKGRPVGSLRPTRDDDGQWAQTIFGELKAPPSPLLRYIEDPEGELDRMLSGYESLERTLQYRFVDRSLLLQALTHASHQQNRLTDCYQRLEFLGDAILDYLITRHLYEDGRRHSPGALTDLRSALVNNTIFATLAARHGFHKYFRHMSPGLNEVLTKYVRIQEENGHSISEEHYLIQEDEMEQAEDVEVPKALGDLFESVAGAIFLDSGMSLGAVWKSYVNLMGAELEAFSAAAPKSPVRELLEAEPDTAKFGKPERLADGRRVRVCVEVFGRGAFKGVGRNYRIAKGTAARCALRHLRNSRPR